MNRRALFKILLGATTFSSATYAQEVNSPPQEDFFTTPEDWAAKLIQAAKAQIGQTVIYDSAYTRLPYPGGDVPIERGVCTDVVVRAYRAGLNIDLQKLVHQDMAASFGSYPKIWGLKRPDPNIDHRRVPNLMTFLKRKGAPLAVTNEASDYKPGDIVTQMVSGNLPHIILVTHHANAEKSRPMIVHNIGQGARLEDNLFAYPITGHFRFKPIG